MTKKAKKKYSFLPVLDGIIPVTENEYFQNDIVSLFVEWLKAAYSEEKLEENLDYIAQTLQPNSNKSSREVIRDYFLNDFVNDHNTIYKHRPIYWMYDSGKQNGFKALIYQHRYNEDTTGRVSVDYIDKITEIYLEEIEKLSKQIEELKELDDSKSKNEKKELEKRADKLRKQLSEVKNYNEKVSRLAKMRISIDLDDGVVVNHQKIQTDENGKNLKILKPIK